MNKFLKRVFCFTGLFLGIIIGVAIILFITPQFIKITEIPKDDYSEILKSQIIIGGDSRASRQLDPALIHQYTSSNTINIAQGAVDLYAVSKGLLALNIADKTIILSASLWQINDGAIQGESFRVESFSDLSFADKIQLYRQDILSLYQRQTRRFIFSLIFRSNARSFYDNTRRVNDGFEKMPCNRQIDVDELFFKNHPFYLNPNFNGIKRKLLIKALYNLSLLRNCKILIYNGPVTTAFRTAAKKNGVYDLEVKYDKIMTDLVKNYKNMKYVSFIDSRAVSDDGFYDPQHLCENGAYVFSKVIAGEIEK